MKVIIGIDPHKASHTAVAIDDHEQELAALQVRANKNQTCRLLEWAACFDDRLWAIESAGGWGYLLGQQLLDADETVVDVPATLAARVRLLGTGRSNKNDPNDALSVAVAAFRAPALTPVRRADHASVLAVLAGRNKQLAASRTRTVCRLHSVLAGLIEGGTGQRLRADRAEALLEEFLPATQDQAARHQVALDHLGDLVRLDAQIVEHQARIRDAVAAANTSVTDIVGVGPIVAAMVIGYTGDVSRFADRHQYASYTGTAPIELSSGGRKIHRLSRRGNRQLNHAMHVAALSQIRYPDTAGRSYYDRKLAEGRTRRDALRALKRRISDAVFRQLRIDAGIINP